ncbi:SsrA-binding protein SmpB [candidate division WWE3 bacterium]|uniref:SsrA-binding protein n=1 Tax=candidate division WWE3 bacterium TaxID=2053526 RepID=A0A955LKC8_UNCKA|nr:SsrA-binding protein SmpB [candidate division WWE3 bacterium]
MDVLATNNKARFNYDLQDKFEAGISLNGAEVKSVKRGNLQIRESYVKITKSGEAHLHNAYIAPYSHAGNKDYNPYRTRKLLLRAEELSEIAAKTHGSNLTIVPIKVYNTSRGLIKLEIALARGKKQYEKRREITKRDIKKEIKGTLKKYHS